MKITLPLKGVGTTPGIYITQKFGENPHIYAQFGMAGHNGWDIAAPRATPVYAVHDGWIVESKAKDTGYGISCLLYFEEDGFGWEVTTGHFLSIEFPDIPYNQSNRNYPVKAGQIIAHVDSTGFSTGNHIHIGIKKFQNGQLLNYNNGYFGSINPQGYIEGSPQGVIMSNAIPVSKVGSMEKGFYLPATSEDSLKDKALNLGLDILKPDGTIDYSLFKQINL